MTITRLLLLPLALSTAIYCKQEDPQLVTKSTALEQSIKDNSHVVLKFTAPWCGACKSPIYNNLATKDDHADVTFLVVDISQGEGAQIAKKYAVRGFPTFLIFEDGKKTTTIVGDYNQLTTDVKAIAKKATTAKAAKKPEPTVVKETPAPAKVQAITSKADLKKHTDGDKPVIVKFYTNWCGFCKKIKPAFDKLADKFQDSVTFLEADGDKASALAAEYNVEGFPTFVSFHKGKKVKEISGADQPQLESHTAELHSLTQKKAKPVKKPEPKVEAPAKKKKIEVTVPKKEDKKHKAPEPTPAPKKKAHRSPGVKEVTNPARLDEEIKDSKPTAVKFYADWCGPCKMVKPIYEEFEKEYGDAMNFVAVNIDDGRAIAEQYKVYSIPHIKFFKNGKEVDKISGASTEMLEQKIKRHAKG